MTRMKPLSEPESPIIHMIEAESKVLNAMASALEKRNPAVADLLYAELERAELHSAEEIPADTVTMNCKVEFVDERSGVSRTVALVYPSDADIAKDRISILTPVGAGLIGMTAGESISWPDRSGTKRLLKIVAVTPLGARAVEGAVLDGNDCHAN